MMNFFCLCSKLKNTVGGIYQLFILPFLGKSHPQHLIRGCYGTSSVLLMPFPSKTLIPQSKGPCLSSTSWEQEALQKNQGGFTFISAGSTHSEKTACIILRMLDPQRFVTGPNPNRGHFVVSHF